MTDNVVVFSYQVFSIVPTCLYKFVIAVLYDTPFVSGRDKAVVRREFVFALGNRLIFLH